MLLYVCVLMCCSCLSFSVVVKLHIACMYCTVRVNIVNIDDLFL